MSRYLSACVCATLVVLVASQSMADIVTYSDRTAFDAAVTDTTTLTFDGLAPANGYAEVPALYTIGGVTLTSGVSMYAVNNAWGFTLGQQVLHMNGTGALVTIPAGKTAFGVDLYRLVDAYVVPKERLTVNFSDSSTQCIEVDFGSMTQDESLFVGMVSTNAAVTITSVTLRAQDLANGYRESTIDNLTYGTAVPEPASITLVVMGLLGVAFYASKNRTLG